MKSKIKPLEIGVYNVYIDPNSHCLIPRWYCRFMFWKKHGFWIQNREFMTFDQLNKK